MRTIVTGAMLLIAATAQAHRLDEYLQATTISLTHAGVQATMRMIPGVAVFPSVLANIDVDANGVISQTEQRAYAEQVHRDVTLTLNGERVRLQLNSWTFPSIETLKEGLGEIQLEFAADVPRTGAGFKLAFENRHRGDIGTYLVNSLLPRDEAIRITAQNRSYDQSSYELDYVRADTPSSAVLSGWSAPWGWADLAGLFLLTGAAWVWRRYRVTRAGRQT
jgi:hypothetical protein